MHITRTCRLFSCRVFEQTTKVGMARRRMHVAPTDPQGRIRADLVPDLPEPMLTCAQALK